MIHQLQRAGVYKEGGDFYRDTIQVLMRDEKKEEKTSKVIQTARQSNTAHPRQSLFLR